jgi:hypothetical protein
MGATSDIGWNFAQECLVQRGVCPVFTVVPCCVLHQHFVVQVLPTPLRPFWSQQLFQWCLCPSDAVNMGLSFLQQYSEAGYTSLDVVGLIYEGLPVSTQPLFAGDEVARLDHSTTAGICAINPESVKEIVLGFVAVSEPGHEEMVTS